MIYLEFYAKILNIYIDDFFCPKKFLTLRKKIYGYNHTNFDLLLKKFKFNKIFYKKSPYKKVLNSNTKSAIFENTAYK